ncbi:MAG: M67 family metallopeptidase [Spirochaetales bacterium]|nr:M67 family metallopeptidase [Spirochaetales bacterium]
MIFIPEYILGEIREQALKELPNEACGYLFGQKSKVILHKPLTNKDHSPEHFSMDPSEQFIAVKEARNKGLIPIAVYHSHPRAPANLSKEDKLWLRDPDMIYIIYSVAKNSFNAFRYHSENIYEEKKIITINQP